MTDAPIWTPDEGRVARAAMTAFRRTAAGRHGAGLPDYAALHQWSVDHPERFWREIWDFAEVIGEPGERVLVDAERMPGARWFPEARLNFAENLLRRRDEADAIVFRGEDRVRRRLSWRELHEAVARLASALRADGVEPGDRVAGYLPNGPDAVIAMLAAASIGAVWCSCSP